MKVRKLIIVVALLLFLILQGAKLTQPFVGEFECAFQEMIALHHLKSGMIHNNFLAVLAEINGERFYHTAHPPLLHIIYALLYRIFGVKEWVSRGFSLLLLFGSIFLLSQLLEREKRKSFWLIALFFPISFRLGLTTNYEPITIFSISLFLFRFERARLNPSPKKIFTLALALLFLVLSDWPAYLVVPALLLLHFRGKRERNWLLGLFLGELILFGGLILYMKLIAGEVALFAHSGTRSHPVYLFRFSTYQEFFEHLNWILRMPTLVLLFFALAKLILNSPKQRISPQILFWGWFLALLWLTASNLVSRHFVYLLYFFPISALALNEILSRSHYKTLATILILSSFFFPDYLGLKTKDARAYYLAQRLKKSLSPQARAFSSAALGSLYFYAKIETVVPVSKKATEYLSEANFDLVLLDRESREVKELAQFISRGNYHLLWEFPELTVLGRPGLGAEFKYLSFELRKENLKNWWSPKPEVIYFEGKAYYALKQVPGPAGISRLDFSLAEDCLCVKPGLAQAPLSGISDGVNVMVLGQTEEGARLSYARFLKARSVQEQKLKLQDVSELSLITDAGPKGNFSYDDFYWLEPRWGENCGGENGD